VQGAAATDETLEKRPEPDLIPIGSGRYSGIWLTFMMRRRKNIGRRGKRIFPKPTPISRLLSESTRN